MTSPESRKQDIIFLSVADDVLRERIAELLSAAGYFVRCIDDGHELFSHTKTQNLSIWIYDGNSQWTADECDDGRQEENIPVDIYRILLIDWYEAGESLTSIDDRADDVITLPLNDQELLFRVHRASEGFRQRAAESENWDKDPLTDVLNRRTFEDRGNREIARASRSHVPLSCALIDIDLFKQVNDTHGHNAGDAVLRSLADFLTKRCRCSDLVFRYGGDEFFVLLPETDEIDATRWAESVCQQFAEQFVVAENINVGATISIGIAQWMSNIATMSQLVDLADQALLAAKHSGRNRCLSFGQLSERDAFDKSLADDYGFLLQGVLARQVMTTPIVCMNENDTLADAADLFLRTRINSVPIVNDEGRMVGIVSEKDLLNTAMHGQAWKRSLRSIMSPNVVHYAEDAPLVSVWNFLRRVTIRRVVVVKDDKPIGVISRGSLLRWMGNWGEICAQAGCRSEGNQPVVPYDSIRKTGQSIDNHLHVLQESLTSPPEEAIPAVVEAATRIQEQTQDLLALSQIYYKFRPKSELVESAAVE